MVYSMHNSFAHTHMAKAKKTKRSKGATKRSARGLNST